MDDRNHPHPGPLPEYREREKVGDRHNEALHPEFRQRRRGYHVAAPARHGMPMPR